MLMSDVCGRNYDSLLELERMKFLEDLPWDSLPNDHDAFPITSEQTNWTFGWRPMKATKIAAG